MLDISVIILTYNEEIHIERCIRNIMPIAKDIFVVDSFSTDRTVEIAGSLSAKIYRNKWESNYARQFNWALKNLPISTRWVLRLDADEYLLPELIAELTAKLPSISSGISGIVFKRRHIFLDTWIRRGVYPVRLLRLFEHNTGSCEERWMDEHIVVSAGDIIEFEHDFADHNLNSIDWWLKKHIGYAVREAIDLICLEIGMNDEQPDSTALSTQAAAKRRLKEKYSKQPLILRAFFYFIFRYFYKRGFLEGKEGFLWHFLQGWWYRTLVDIKIIEIKKACGSDPEKLREYLKKNYSIIL